MLDDLLELGASFDWLSPLVTIFKHATNGPSHTFLIPADCGWSGMEINRLLKSRGIKTWGLMVVNHTILVTTTKEKAGWAQHLLDQQGIPVETPFVNSGRSKSRSKPAQPKSEKQPRRTGGGLIETINQGIDNLFGF